MLPYRSTVQYVFYPQRYHSMFFNATYNVLKTERLENSIILHQVRTLDIFHRVRSTATNKRFSDERSSVICSQKSAVTTNLTILWGIRGKYYITSIQGGAGKYKPPPLTSLFVIFGVLTVTFRGYCSFWLIANRIASWGTLIKTT